MSKPFYLVKQRWYTYGANNKLRFKSWEIMTYDDFDDNPDNKEGPRIFRTTNSAKRAIDRCIKGQDKECRRKDYKVIRCEAIE